MEAFRRMDTTRTGQITIQQLNALLKRNDLILSPDDLYHLLTGYDTNMDGLISYFEFVTQTLNIFKANH
ncbi:unnamed protein product [Protopolystoma xenopodis]|uniref:EF-hand domain-containing protein n=1 Tax=Protopolystoma xenopodis TaxID=117903 RepID=A0A448WPV8_9PLAT|nr:unnamed protein product [Protopolystoma xenopodis]